MPNSKRKIDVVEGVQIDPHFADKEDIVDVESSSAFHEDSVHVDRDASR